MSIGITSLGLYGGATEETTVITLELPIVYVVSASGLVYTINSDDKIIYTIGEPCEE